MIKFRTMCVCLMVVLALFACKSKKPQTENEPVEANPITEEADVGGEKSQIQDPIEIAFGEYDKMFNFSKKCQNNEFAEGQVVIIDGEMAVYPTSASVGQRNADGDQYIGTSVVVTGWTNENYPGDGSHVKVKAVTVLNKDYGFLSLVADPADVTVISDTNEEDEE